MNESDSSGVATSDMPLRRIAGRSLSQLMDLEWLVTNGLGGYASGTVAGATTRRYHGLLIAAHPAPLGRIMTLNHLTEQFRCPDSSVVSVGGTERADGTMEVHGAELLIEFRLEWGLPIWLYKTGSHVIQKRIYMPHNQNTVHIVYNIASGPGPVRVKLRPSVHFRGHEQSVDTPNPLPYTFTATNGRYELHADSSYPTLRFRIEGIKPSLTLDGISTPEILYRNEATRGYEGKGVIWSPGEFRVELTTDHYISLTASTESWQEIMALSPPESLELELSRRRNLIAAATPSAQSGISAELVLAADQFIITPASRTEDTARAKATGDSARTIIAGYHWFTDWGRDTMISLEGLTLVTGRHHEARYILTTFAAHVRDGLIPNFFPDKASEGVYHTADATLWFIHAIDRYSVITQDVNFMQTLLPVLRQIISCHISGTRYGIGMDPVDGLLKQGAEGYQLTWMDAKCGDWVVTPRRGKAVEINALWYNALCFMSRWHQDEGDSVNASFYRHHADAAFHSFNRRFWCDEKSGLYDVIDGPDGNDNSCRPNQIFAIALPHPVLAQSKWAAIIETCRTRLLTPFGLRSLAPGEPDYKDKYFGDLGARDAAYHQGTVWAWLIGPFIDAWCKTYPDRIHECYNMLEGFQRHLNDGCIGSVSEVFDAESPDTPRACIAQAWSVAEVLRSYTKIANLTNVK